MPSRLINLSLDNSRFVDRLRADAERRSGRKVSQSEVVNITLDYLRERIEKDDTQVDLETLLPIDPA